MLVDCMGKLHMLFSFVVYIAIFNSVHSTLCNSCADFAMFFSTFSYADYSSQWLGIVWSAMMMIL